MKLFMVGLFFLVASCTATAPDPSCSTITGTVLRGQDGYRTVLDRDMDGIACEG